MKQTGFVYKMEDKKVTADDLIKLVGDTFDPAILEKMKDGEKRVTVLEAIEKRLEELKGE